VIVRDLDYSLSEPDFWISFRESYHESSNFALCPYFTIFQWLYFGSAWRYSHMVGRATSFTRTVYIDVTLTRSKVKVKVTGLFNFRQLAKPCVLAAMTAAPLRGFLVLYRYLFTSQNDRIYCVAAWQESWWHSFLFHIYFRGNVHETGIAKLLYKR